MPATESISTIAATACHLKVSSLVIGFRFAQADTTQLWINENRIGHQSILNRSLPIFQQIGTNDAEVIVRDMGESRAALHIPQRINIRYIGLQSVVNPNIAVFVHFDTDHSQIKPIRVGGAARRDQQMGTD
jgi:hypothetical protein